MILKLIDQYVFLDQSFVIALLIPQSLSNLLLKLSHLSTQKFIVALIFLYWQVLR